MARPGHIHRLTERIRRILARGLPLGEGARHFIESTLPDPSPAAVAVLATGIDGDGATLAELLFFPDEAFQARLEDCLLEGAFEPPDAETLAARLRKRPPLAVIRCAGGAENLELAMPCTVAGPFVTRLRIWRQPDRRLTKTLSGCLPEDSRREALVMLRNARLLPGAAAVEWLCRLVRRGGASLGIETLLNHLRFALSVLEDLPEGADIRSRLADRRTACLAALQRMDQIAALRDEAPMETLIMGRFAAPHVDPADIYRQVAMIDTLCELTGCAAHRFQPAIRQGWST